jgi:glycosyltransferase involved in cell wall biosynthesis
MPVRRLNKLAPLVARFLINISVRRAAIICTISNVARSEIESIYRLAPGRIRVTYPGVSPRFEAAPETKVAEIRGKYGLSRPFFLYVGTWLPRKNLPRLIEAFRIFCNTTSTDYELILVGPRVAAPRGKTLELIRDVETAQNVRSLGFVPDEDMPGIYAASEALVFPSLSEGFGLPVIEAMACGTPVIVSGVSCLPEVAGDAALIINPEDPADIARAMNLVLDPGLRQELRQKGLERARFFTWENAALETEKAYTDALHRES